MTLQAQLAPWPMLIGAAARQVRRRPYLSLSVAAHGALLALLYYFGSYRLELREQEAEVSSSLQATHQASAAKRLQDLQTIKQLLEKSADRADAESSPATAPPPQTPEETVAQARELSREIDALDRDIQAKELAELVGAAKPSSPAGSAPAALPQAPVAPMTAASAGTQAAVTAEMAASEVAALEEKARATLARRLQRLQAKANGVQVEGDKPGSPGKGAGHEGAGSGGQAAGANPAARPRRDGTPDTSVQAEIADFIGEGDRLGQAERSQGYSGSDFFDHGSTQIPAVDTAGMVLGRGRMLGAGGEYANRVYLNSWYLIGPFPGRHEAGLFDNPSYPPEKAVLLDAVYFGKDKRLLRWRYVTAQSYPLVPPDMVEDSVFYGYTEVFVDQARDLTAWIGADDDVQVYLNDRLVWKGGNVNKQSYFNAIFDSGNPHLSDYNRTEGQRVLHFEKGRNRIFFKLSNGPNSAFLSFVLTP